MIQVLFRKAVGTRIAVVIHDNMKMAIHGAASRIPSEIVSTRKHTVKTHAV